MQFLKADTAATVLIGPFLDKTDGVTPETGVTLAGADSAEIMKHDGTTFQDISALTFTHKAHGMYTLAITSGFLDTEGRLTVFVSDESLCLPVWAEYMVVNANVYDSLFAAATTDYLQVDALQLGGDTQSATDLKDFADAGYDPGTNKVQGVVLTDTCTTNTDLVSAADVVNEWETQSQADPTGFHVNVMEVNGTAQTANDNGADINAILTDTDELQQDWTNTGRLDTILDTIAQDTTTDIPTSIAALPTAAEIQAEMEENGASLLDTIADKLPTNYIMGSSDVDNHDTDIDSILQDTNELQGDWTNTGRLDTILDTIAADTTTDIPAAITAAHGTTDGLIGTVDTVVDGIQTDLDNGTDGLGALKALIDALNDITAADVWDATEAITGTTLSFETIMARVYRFLFNKMNITDSSGAVALRNEADDGDIMTNTITDNDTTTVRTAGSWS